MTAAHCLSSRRPANGGQRNAEDGPAVADPKTHVRRSRGSLQGFLRSGTKAGDAVQPTKRGKQQRLKRGCLMQDG